MQYCLSCFHREEQPFSVCPQCGMPMDIKPKEPVHLKPGTILQGRYLIGRSVGAGGFGVVYKAFDIKLEVVIAVKEFFMSRLTTRSPGSQEIIIYQKGKQEFDYRKERFLAEARAMALFNNHESIPYVLAPFTYFYYIMRMHINHKLLLFLCCVGYCHILVFIHVCHSLLMIFEKY